MSRHFRVSISESAEGFSVEVKEQLSMTSGRTVLCARESATSTAAEIADVVREAVVDMLQELLVEASAESAR